MSGEPARGFATELRARGYAVLPAPQRVCLETGSTSLRGGWELVDDGVRDAALLAGLLEGAGDRHGVAAPPDVAPVEIALSVREGAVALEKKVDPLCVPQAYRLTIAPGRVEIVGNGDAGLYYGVQTLAQLLSGNRMALPIVEIVDWPAYPLRIVHWDTKHHQDRLETLRRFVDQLGAFKINAIAFELDDKFEYPSHPVIGAPGAFTTEEMADLTRYALARHIQIIPNIQAPAHMAYVLKHEEFAHLRCDGSNYLACMEDPEAVRLIFDMYDDVIAATPGVDYFLVSTDEIYYAGICEKYRPYNPENRAKIWCEFANKAAAHLGGRGRRAIMWIEFPLRAGDVRSLDEDIIDGVIGTDDCDEQIRIEREKGMRQLCYASMQGMEQYYPNYFPMPGTSPERGRLADAREQTLQGKATRGDPIGIFSAAWDDSGLHNETFWLGWGAMAQGGWSPGRTTIEQNVADFMDLFYGPDVLEMVEAHRGLQAGARFCEGLWDRVVSTERPPAYGYSEKKYPFPRYDELLFPPPLPSIASGEGEGASPSLDYAPEFRSRYERQLAAAEDQLIENDRLLVRLQANLARATRNRYNIEVLLSLAALQRHTIEMVLALARVEDALVDAASHAPAEPARAINALNRAHGEAGRVIADLHDTFERLKSVWEVSRFEKCRSVDGRDFLHVMDDVKDHIADRRADLTYLIMAERRIDLPGWRDRLGRLIEEYGRATGVSVKIESPHE